MTLRMMNLHPRRLLPLVSTILLAGCGDGPAGVGGTPPPTAGIKVANILYQSARNGSTDPAVDTLATGGTATWTWTESGTHTVRFDDAGLPESPPFSDDGSVFSRSFPAAGTYTYDCGIHGLGMTGTIVVK
ncbi:MAG TPA: hypothetical protein VGP44_13035 [Gemmatimonadales bacterium]|nr:hypothetical protein [Gemmatimonadales bacterium]